MLAEQIELQATVSQMRDELRSKDAELARLKPDHRPSFWAEAKAVSAAPLPPLSCAPLTLRRAR